MKKDQSRQAANRKKYDKAKMGHLCTIRIRKKNIPGLKRAKGKMRGLSWTDILYRGLGLKRGD